MRLVTQAADFRLDTLTALVDGGLLLLCQGERPSLEKPLAEDAVLATLRLSSPAFAPARDGIAIARTIEPALATGSGTASFFRLLSRDGAVAADGTAGVGDDSDLILTNAQVVVGAQVRIRQMWLDDRACLKD